MSESLISLLTWPGSVSLITAYWLGSQGRLGALSVTHRMLAAGNFLLLLVNTLYHFVCLSGAMNII